jgi:hypothetical protein
MITIYDRCLISQQDHNPGLQYFLLLGIKVFSTQNHAPIYAIYVLSVSDEIVDTFHEHDKLALLHVFVKILSGY